jgi:hypothetical protein
MAQETLARVLQSLFVGLDSDSVLAATLEPPKTDKAKSWGQDREVEGRVIWQSEAEQLEVRSNAWTSRCELVFALKHVATHSLPLGCETEKRHVFCFYEQVLYLRKHSARISAYGLDLDEARGKLPLMLRILGSFSSPLRWEPSAFLKAVAQLETQYPQLASVIHDNWQRLRIEDPRAVLTTQRRVPDWMVPFLLKDPRLQPLVGVYEPKARQYQYVEDPELFVDLAEAASFDSKFLEAAQDWKALAAHCLVRFRSQQDPLFRLAFAALAKLRVAEPVGAETLVAMMGRGAGRVGRFGLEELPEVAAQALAFLTEPQWSLASLERKDAELVALLAADWQSSALAPLPWFGKTLSAPPRRWRKRLADALLQ